MAGKSAKRSKSNPKPKAPKGKAAKKKQPKAKVKSPVKKTKAQIEKQLRTLHLRSTSMTR